MISKTCLLIIPNGFYSFHKLIKEALEVKGYNVTVANDEYPQGSIGKILGKLQLPIVFKTTFKHINDNFLNNKKYKLVLIFKGRGMSNKLIDQLSLNADAVVGYNWDSFKYNRGPLKWYKNVNRYYTFDFEDSEEYSLPTVELFSSLLPSGEPKVVKYEVSALFRNHSERLKYLDKVLVLLKSASCFIYIYEQNIFTLATNFIRNPFLYIKYWKYIQFKALPYSSYLDALKHSEFTIDYAHDDQSGITMRCYEAISMDTKIITNNVFVGKSQYFNDSNSIVFPLDGNSTNFTNSYMFCKLKSFKANYRTIYNFLDDLILGVESKS